MKPASTSSQNELRRQMLARRRSLDAKLIEKKSNAITQRLAQSEAFQSARTIGLYLPINGEVDTRFLIRLALDHGKRIALPRIDDRDIRFHPYDEGQHQRGAFGIDEPTGDSVVAIDSIDLLCLPLVAFDPHGHRIGMGGGYYDRALEAFKNQQKPWRFGLAYELQKLDNIQSNPWDIPLHSIVTERKLYTVT